MTDRAPNPLSESLAEDAKEAARRRILRTLREVLPNDSLDVQRQRADALFDEVSFCLDVAATRAAAAEHSRAFSEREDDVRPRVEPLCVICGQPKRPHQFRHPFKAPSAASASEPSVSSSEIDTKLTDASARPTASLKEAIRALYLEGVQSGMEAAADIGGYNAIMDSRNRERAESARFFDEHWDDEEWEPLADLCARLRQTADDRRHEVARPEARRLGRLLHLARTRGFR